ncbi:hypothetical protein [Pseudomonas sp. W03]|uniref:hypothetical protein n=1 Tax=Pseudomonas sp. W03 TaxID=3090666 RepID=UPI003A4D5AF5
MLLVVSCWLIFGFSPQRGFPDPASLQSLTEQVSWVETSRNSVSFGLKGHDLRFIYPKSAGEVSRVLSHLRSGLPVTVRYAEPASDDESVLVWGLLGRNVSIRSFDEIAERRKRDNYLAIPLGLLCLVAALYYFDRSWRLYEGRSFD